MRVKFQAHRGLSTSYPENTLISFEAAIEAGYEIIELDPKMTKDLRCVILHDQTINRTARKIDGQPLDAVIERNINDCSFKELRTLDFGRWKGAEFAGTLLPTLSEVLFLIEKNTVLFKFDNVFESFNDLQKSSFFGELKTSTCMDKIALTCTSVTSIKEVLANLPDVWIHYDGYIDEKVLKANKELFPSKEITYWLPYQNELTSWCELPKADESLCRLVKKFGKLGIWTIQTECEQTISVEEFHADAIETNGQLTP